MWGSRGGTAHPRDNHVRPKGVLSEIDLKILWAARTITSIDLMLESDLLKIDRSTIHRDLKTPVREALISTYRDRRAPYEKLLTDLQRQQSH